MSFNQLKFDMLVIEKISHKAKSLDERLVAIDRYKRLTAYQWEEIYDECDGCSDTIAEVMITKE